MTTHDDEKNKRMAIAHKYASIWHTTTAAERSEDHFALWPYDYDAACVWEPVLCQNITRRLRVAVGNEIAPGGVCFSTAVMRPHECGSDKYATSCQQYVSYMLKRPGNQARDAAWHWIEIDGQGRRAFLQGLTERCGANSPIRKWSRNVLFDDNLVRLIIKAF